MNIAMLTTWKSACGIAEYSKNLVKEFYDMGHNILLLTNKEDEWYGRTPIHKVFGVHWWGEDSSFKCFEAQQAWRQFEDKFGHIDVFYIQYQSSLYHEVGFNDFLKWANSCPIIITFHDSSLNQKHIFPDNVVSIVHNESIDADFYIPFPTVVKTPRVFSFGMGRNDYKFIEEACKELGISFTGYDSRKQGWLDEEMLFTAMKNADAIVLWYNDVAIQGQSAALRTAISSHRPVIVNDVGWFADAPSFVYKAYSKEGLQRYLYGVLNLGYIRENSFENCAKKYLEVLNEID